MALRAAIALASCRAIVLDDFTAQRIRDRTLPFGRRAWSANFRRVRIVHVRRSAERKTIRPPRRLSRAPVRIDNCRRLASAKSLALGARRLQFGLAGARVEQSAARGKKTRHCSRLRSG